MSRFINNFLNGMAFGMLSSNPFFGGCYGFGMYPMMYNRVDFGSFANPFPSVFGYGYYSSSASMMMPTTFANASFPTVDFTEVGQYIWNSATNPDSDFNRQLLQSMENQWQSQSPSFSNFQMTSNPYSWFGSFDFLSSKKSGESSKNNSRDSVEVSDSNLNRYDDKRFKRFLSIILKREGGYSDSKVDRGGKTLKGVTHTTYDSYRKSKGLSTQSVTKMTDDEMQEIYYEMFYKASGADKISDKKLALYVFDTAVNMGVGVAKEFLEACNGDRNKFEQLRKSRYRRIIERDKTQKANEKGWNNRMVAIKDAADNQLNTIA